MSEDQSPIPQTEPLIAVSNVIELKPGHKYLLVFKGPPIALEQLVAFQEYLRGMGVSNVSVHLPENIELDVIEAPEEASHA